MKKKNNKRGYRFETRAIHDDIQGHEWQGATQPPIYQSAAHIHDTAENLSQTFAGQTGDHIYMRLSNPTNRHMENKLADLESGKAAIVTGSGMAAINNACMTLLRAGDEFVASSSLFMSTFALFTNIYKKYGITVRLADPMTLEGIAACITDKTRFIYLETITNPGMEIPDIKAVADLAHANGVPLVMDNTLASPWLCRPLELGADIVIHSTTKYFSGHGASLGGVVIDKGGFNWDTEKFSDFSPFAGNDPSLSFLTRMFREYHVNFGTTQAPFHSFLTAIGLSTMGVRMEKHMSNAMAVATFLKNHPRVNWVNYPGFEDHPCHAMARRQFGHRGFGTMLTFGLSDQAACFCLIDSLEMILNLANLGDSKSLIIHPYSSQYVNFPQKQRDQLADPGLLRFSVGIEHPDDICEDLDQALKKTNTKP